MAATLAGVAVLAASDAAHVARSRLRRLTSPVSPHGPGPGPEPEPEPEPGPVAVGGFAAVLMTAVAVLVVAALVVATLVVAIRWLGRGPVLAAVAPMLLLLALRRQAARSAVRRQRCELSTALPRFADLVAACLESGAAPADAVDAVRRHLPGPVADRLAPVVGALRSGFDPLTVYDGSDRDDPVRGLVVALARAMESGAPLADTVAAVADDQRRRRRWSAEAAARRAGVQAVVPLVMCFLPAFVLLGVVPVVLAIAAEVLGDLS